MEQKQEQLSWKLSTYETNNIFIEMWPTKEHLKDYLQDRVRSLIRWLSPQKEKKYIKRIPVTYGGIQEEYRGIKEAIMELKME